MEVIQSIVLFLIFIFGSIIGSFYGMLSTRAAIEEEMPFKKRYGITGRSFCPSCKHDLSAIDLIPLLSFVFLRGKCRYCSAAISYFYPVMELFMGAGFVLVYLFNLSNWSNLSNLIFLLVIVSVLIEIFVTDLFFGIIPDLFVVIGSVAVLIHNITQGFNYFTVNLITAAFSFGFFYALLYLTKRFLGKEGIGGGDITFAFLIGLLLGPLLSFYAFWISFVVGAIVSLVFVSLRSKKFSDTIPLGPFLVVGTFLVFFWGKEISTLFCQWMMLCL